jgi:RHS repeat-associated protein
MKASERRRRSVDSCRGNWRESKLFCFSGALRFTSARLPHARSRGPSRIQHRLLQSIKLTKGTKHMKRTIFNWSFCLRRAPSLRGPELGLYDLRNRFYSPDIGRFLQPDPIGFRGDRTNLYRYCRNNPVTEVGSVWADGSKYKG